MSDLGWRADGIARARAAGGVELETYRRPGFAGGRAVRRVRSEVASGFGFEVGTDPGPDEYEESRSWRIRPRP